MEEHDSRGAAAMCLSPRSPLVLQVLLTVVALASSSTPLSLATFSLFPCSQYFGACKVFEDCGAKVVGE